jgi:hypothetical protein
MDSVLTSLLRAAHVPPAQCRTPRGKSVNKGSTITRKSGPVGAREPRLSALRSVGASAPATAVATRPLLRGPAD